MSELNSRVIRALCISFMLSCLHVADAQVRRLWTSTLPGTPWEFVSHTTKHFVLARGGDIAAMDLRSGRFSWQRPVSRGSNATSPQVVALGQSLVVAFPSDGGRVVALSEEKGEVQWAQVVPGLVGVVSVDGKAIVVHKDNTGRIIAGEILAAASRPAQWALVPVANLQTRLLQVAGTLFRVDEPDAAGARLQPVDLLDYKYPSTAEYVARHKQRVFVLSDTHVLSVGDEVLEESTGLWTGHDSHRWFTAMWEVPASGIPRRLWLSERIGTTGDPLAGATNIVTAGEQVRVVQRGRSGLITAAGIKPLSESKMDFAFAIGGQLFGYESPQVGSSTGVFQLGPDGARLLSKLPAVPRGAHSVRIIPIKDGLLRSTVAYNAEKASTTYEYFQVRR